MYTFLSGGTGTPKLLLGFREIMDESDLGVICNTGDDYEWNGLHVSPDLDTVLYLFSNRLDLNKFWGVKDDKTNALDTLQSLGKDTWFTVGDKDLGLHIFRTDKLNDGESLSEITIQIRNQWDIKAIITPMCDTPLRSIIYSSEGKLNFQEYFVKHEWEPEVETVKFEGDKNQISNTAERLLETGDKIILGPSNPITSIGPMLALNPLNNLLQQHNSKVIAISPIMGDQAFSGPTANLMRACNVEVSPNGLGEYYKGLVSSLILDPGDEELADRLDSYGIEPVFHSIMIKSKQQQVELAEFIRNSF